MWRFVPIFFLGFLWPGMLYAADEDPFGRLKSEPLTLFDWGLAQLDREMTAAAIEGFGDLVRAEHSKPAAGARYDQEREQIMLSATMALPPGDRTAGRCMTAFHGFLGVLIRETKRGYDPASWFLLKAFQPEGHGSRGNGKELGRQLLDRVRLHVTLIPRPSDVAAGDKRFVSCHGRLDAAPDEVAVEEMP